MFNRQHRIINLFSWLILIFIMLPLLITVVTSFGRSNLISFPVHSFSLKWYRNILNQPDIINGLEISGYYAILACLLSFLVGTPAIYAMTHYHVTHQRWFQAVFLSPVFLPEIVMGFAFYEFVVMTLHVSSLLALLVGYFALSLPFIIRFLAAGMLDLDPDLEKAAWICGSTKLNTFFKIVLPNLWPYIIAALILGFMNSFNSLTISIFLTGPGTSTLPSALYNYIQQNDDPTISAVSVLLMLVTVIIMIVVDHELGIDKLVRKGK